MQCPLILWLLLIPDIAVAHELDVSPLDDFLDLVAGEGLGHAFTVIGHVLIALMSDRTHLCRAHVRGEV